ncbi:unnamed protein product [Ilex paraguariensis]|uniref:Uncharacterized protein n=1 Tax=Ilex paraguariensis TaxID=185542 RepID=A0ABC8R4L7_9AQUA
MLGDVFPLSNRVGLEVCDDAIKSAHTLGDVSALGNTRIVLSIFEKGNLGYVEMDKSLGDTVGSFSGGAVGNFSLYQMSEIGLATVDFERSENMADAHRGFQGNAKVVWEASNTNEAGEGDTSSHGGNAATDYGGDGLGDTLGNNLGIGCKEKRRWCQCRIR